MTRSRALKWTLPCLVSAALRLFSQPLDVFDHSPDAYLGADACAACHAEQFAKQSASGHARSLHPTADHPAAASFAPSQPLVRTGGARYSYRADEGGLLVEITAQGSESNLASNGRSAQASRRSLSSGRSTRVVTSSTIQLLRRKRRAGNYAGSSQRSGTGDRRSTGRVLRNIRPAALDHALLPVPLDRASGTRRGFLASAARAGGALRGLSRARPESRRAVASGQAAQAIAAIKNPARLSGIELLEDCGQCHRPPASSGQVIDWSDPWNVRHQPVYLSRSACAQPGGQPLACMQCHDPHAPLSAEGARDNRRCLECHEGRVPPAQICRQAAGRACSDCHMPPVRPQDELRFTNHWIGIYDPDNPLRPLDASGTPPR